LLTIFSLVELAEARARHQLQTMALVPQEAEATSA